MLRDYRAELVDIHDIGWCLLVGAAQDEFQLLRWHADGLEDRGYYIAVVLSALINELDGCFEIVEKSMLLEGKGLATMGADDSWS